MVKTKQHFPRGTIIKGTWRKNDDRTIYYNYLDKNNNLNWSEDEYSTDTIHNWSLNHIEVVKLGTKTIEIW